jgi:hypothetical protein
MELEIEFWSNEEFEGAMCKNSARPGVKDKTVHEKVNDLRVGSHGANQWGPQWWMRVAV